MADHSKIEWTDRTFNPWMGCTRVSEGCVHCYAETMMDARYGKVKWGPRGQRVRTSKENWRKPLRWNQEEWVECKACGWRGANNEIHPCPYPVSDLSPVRQRVFCASLADVFEDNPQVANWRGELFQLIEMTPNLDWLILTKRPERIFSLGTDAAGEIFDLWLARQPNVWLGASVESQDVAQKRVAALNSMLARVKFLSVEPLLGPLSLKDAGAVNVGGPAGTTWRKVDWVIVGGESGKDCRPMNMEWARSLRDECQTAGVKFFMKQLGGHPNKRDQLVDMPDDLRIREWPGGER